MGKIDERLGYWPRNKIGEPIFKTGEEAIFYATLIYDNKIFISEIRAIRRRAIQEVKEQRRRRGVNLDRLYIVAMKGQFAREILEEVQRLQDIDIQLKAGEKK